MTGKRKSTGRILAAACLGLAVLGTATAPRAEEKRQPAVDPRAERVFMAALANVAAAKSFSFRAEVSRDVPTDSGQRIQYLGTLSSHVRRPNRLVASYRGEDRENDMVYDGKLFTLANPADKVYANWPAPDTLDALFDQMQEKLGFAPPLSILLRQDAGAGLMKNLRSGMYVGRVTMRGEALHHLAFAGPQNDFQVWVTDGEPVIRRVVVTFKQRPTAPQYTVNFLDWKFNPTLEDYLFTFEPAPGASRIEFKVVEKQ